MTKNMFAGVALAVVSLISSVAFGSLAHCQLLTQPQATGQVPKYLATVQRLEPIETMVYSADGSLLATGNWGNTVLLWDAHTSQLLHMLRGHTSNITALAFSPDGKLLASGSGDKKVIIWTVSTGAQREVLPQKERITSLCFAPTGQFLAVATWATVFLCQVSDVVGDPSPIVWTWPQAETNPEVVTFSPDGALLATGSWDHQVRLWDAHTFKLLRTLSGHSGGVTRLSFAADGKTLASGTGNGEIKLWDVVSGKAQRTLSKIQAFVSSLALAADASTIASAQDSENYTVMVPGLVIIWDAATGDVQRILPATGPVRLAPDGKTLATANNNTILLWDTQTWKLQATMP